MSGTHPPLKGEIRVEQQFSPAKLPKSTSLASP
jgi:hypothetical protein